VINVDTPMTVTNRKHKMIHNNNNKMVQYSHN